MQNPKLSILAKKKKNLNHLQPANAFSFLPFCWHNTPLLQTTFWSHISSPEQKEILESLLVFETEFYVAQGRFELPLEVEMTLNF